HVLQCGVGAGGAENSSDRPNTRRRRWMVVDGRRIGCRVAPRSRPARQTMVEQIGDRVDRAAEVEAAGWPAAAVATKATHPRHQVPRLQAFHQPGSRFWLAIFETRSSTSLPTLFPNAEHCFVLPKLGIDVVQVIDTWEEPRWPEARHENFSLVEIINSYWAAP